MLNCFFRAAVVLVLLAPALARAQMADSKVEIEAFVDHDAVVPGGKAVVALRLTVLDGYHIQSAKPLDADFIATKVAVKADPKAAAAATVKALPVQYPDHQTIAAPGLTTSGKLAVYEGTVYVLVPVEIPTDAAGELKLNLKVTTQACNDQSCDPPQTVPVAVSMKVAAAGTTPAEANATIFAAAKKQTFLPSDKPEAVPTPTPTPTTVPTATGSNTTGLTTPPSAGETAGVAGSADDLSLIQQRDYRPAVGVGGAGETPVWQLMLLALGGGVILNVMPCVLPVVPLKVLTLVQQAHGKRSVAILHAGVFGAGIITLFLALAAVAGILRTFGVQVIYGQQFQSPAFLIGMGYIVLALSLSMLNVWTINTPQAVYSVDTNKGGLVGSFMMGLLATLLATPCSAPLLGPVLAWALVKPIVLTMFVFALVGIGMAIPYVLLAAFPAGLNKLPRAGRWTELLKQFLGIVMIGVAVYLLLQLPVGVLPWALTGALIVALVCWGWGQIPTYAMTLARIWTIRGAVMAVGLIAGVSLYRFVNKPALDESTWRPFNVAEMDQALKDGRPVLVDFTASWCINCKYVEATVLQAPTVRQPLQQKNALLLKVDLTSDNPSGQALLQKLDSRSIPVLAVFTPKAPLTPSVLRDIYSKDSLLGAIND